MDFSIKRIPNPCARVSLRRDSPNTFHSGSHPYGSLFRLPVPPVCFGGAVRQVYPIRGPVGEDKNFAGWHWRPGRFLLSFCTACGLARLSVRGRLIKNGHSPEGGIRSNDGQREDAQHILVVHHDVLRRGEVAATDGEVDCRKEKGGSRRLCVMRGSLVQQSVSPTIPISEDLQRQEKYPSAEWTYFASGVEVCRESFREHLNQVYAARASRLQG